ncbi:hypothetical protein Tco_0396193 [Tanacetum coccineum]
MFRRTPVISAGFQAKMSKFCLSKEHSSLRPFLCYVVPMALSVKGMTLLLCNVTVPPLTGNFNIPCAVDGTARIFLMPGLPYYWHSVGMDDLMNHEINPCGKWNVLSSPIFTSRLSGQAAKWSSA